MTGASLYDTDILIWSEQQAAALRRLKRSGVSSAIDWTNVIGGIEQVGLTELREVENHVRVMLGHAIQGYCDPDSHSRIRWSIETGRSAQELGRFFTESMRARIDLDRLWQQAFDRAMPVVRTEVLSIPPAIPAHCPFTLDELLDDRFTYEAAVRRLYERLTGPSPDQS